MGVPGSPLMQERTAVEMRLVLLSSYFCFIIAQERNNYQLEDVSESVCSGGQDEYLRDGKHCERYFRCANGVPVEFHCALGTLWSRELSICDWANKVKCNPGKPHPEILMNFNYRKTTPKQLLKDTEELMRDIRDVHDAVGSVKKEDVTFANVIKPLIDLDIDSYTRRSAIDFASNVAIDKSLRDASNEAKKKLAELDIDMSLRKDVFNNIVAFDQTEEANYLKSFEPEISRFLEKRLQAGQRNGLHLEGEQLEEFKTIKKRISELGITFRQCLSEDTSHIFVDEADLEGVPEDLISSFERDSDGKCKVTTKYPHYYPVIKKCKNPKTRERMERVYQTRCVKENTPIIEELVQLRQNQATILGYKNHAAYKQEVKMAKNPEAVTSFLDELGSNLQTLWKNEKEYMLNLKREEMEERQMHVAEDILNKEDFWYYNEMVQDKKYSVDQEKLKEYFPLEVVTKGLMEIYQRLLGLTFTKETEGEVWHDEVELYRVDDTATGEIIGYFFMDMFPRDGKYGHAAMWQLQPASLNSSGKRQKSVASMVCNFPKPSGGKPSLLSHKQVKTFFHEFGHVMHGICSKTNISMFFGTNVEGDFVEAPSQMLENWVWQEESLRMMSGHYKDGSPIPKDLLQKLVASKKANSGGLNLRQIFFGTFDMTIHTRAKADTMEIARELYRDLLGIERINGTNIGANLGHLVGYDAGYYGYLWSKVFSQDMFDTRFAKEGILNPKTGMDYRKKILEPGATKDAGDLLRNFLGRDPNQDAFRKSIGLNA